MNLNKVEKMKKNIVSSQVPMRPDLIISSLNILQFEFYHIFAFPVFCLTFFLLLSLNPSFTSKVNHNVYFYLLFVSRISLKQLDDDKTFLNCVTT